MLILLNLIWYFVMKAKKLSHDDSGLLGEEDVKRFDRAFSLCRTCNHIMMAHSFVTDKRGKCLDAGITNKEVYETCKCKIFIPKDNLEFLEWAAQKKERGE